MRRVKFEKNPSGPMQGKDNWQAKRAFAGDLNVKACIVTQALSAMLCVLIYPCTESSPIRNMDRLLIFNEQVCKSREISSWFI